MVDNKLLVHKTKLLNIKFLGQLMLHTLCDICLHTDEATQSHAPRPSSVYPKRLRVFLCIICTVIIFLALVMVGVLGDMVWKNLFIEQWPQGPVVKVEHDQADRVRADVDNRYGTAGEPRAEKCLTAD